MKRLPCACGGYVVASRMNPAPGVRAHQATEPHKAWRTREHPEPTATERDLSARPVRPFRVLVGLGYEL